MGNEGMNAGQLLKQANRLKRAGSLDEAIALYHQAIEVNPNYAWTFHYLGNALIEQGKLDDAIAYYYKSVKISPNSAWFSYSLGEALAKRGELETAAEYLQKAVDIKPNFYKFYNSLGRVLAQLGNSDEAKSNYSKAAELKSKSAYYNTKVSCTEPTLTIGIPTYNRCEAVTASLMNLQKSVLPDNVRILVIDNASTDGSCESLLKIHNPEITRILQNDTNIGYAKNFIKLLRKCDTDYILVTSDEDFVIPKNLDYFLEFIKTTPADFISPQVIDQNGEIYRGKKRNDKIDLYNYRHSSNYISGITFKISSSSLGMLNKIEEYMDKSFEIAKFYPQVLLGMMYVLQGSAYWYNQPICKRAFSCDSSLKFNTVQSRWDQYTSFIDVFLDLLNDPEYYSLQDRVKEMLELFLNSFNLQLSVAMSIQRKDIPGLATYLERSYKKIEICKRDDRYHFSIIE